MRTRFSLPFVLLALGAGLAAGPAHAAAPEPPPAADLAAQVVGHPRAAVLDLFHSAAQSFLLAPKDNSSDTPLVLPASRPALRLAADYETLFMPLTAGWARVKLEAWLVRDTERGLLADDAAEAVLFGPARQAGRLKLDFKLPPGLSHVVVSARTAARAVGVTDWTVDEASFDLWVLVPQSGVSVPAPVQPTWPGLGPTTGMNGSQDPAPAPIPAGGLGVGAQRGVVGADAGGALNFETGQNATLVVTAGDEIAAWSDYEVWWAAGAAGGTRVHLAVLPRPVAGAPVDGAPLADDNFETRDTGPRLTDGALRAAFRLRLPGTYNLVARLTTTILRGDNATTDQDDVPFTVKVLPNTPPTGAITGKVVGDDGLAIAGIVLVAYNADGRAVAKARTNADGGYRLDGLDPGAVTVQAVPGDLNFLGEWWNDKPSRDTADAVKVEAGAVVDGIDFTLTPGATITGRVTNAAGDGLGGIEITVGARTPAAGGTVSPAPVIGTDGLFRVRTNDDGNYSVDHLPRGVYWVRAADPAGHYLTLFYKGQDTLDKADPVQLAAGGARSGIDFTLEPGGAISGQVRAESPQSAVIRLAGILVEVRAVEHPEQVLGSAVTNGDGHYTIGGLRSGHYLVRAMDPAGRFAVEWYKESAGPDGAQPVGVRPGSTIDGIDFTLAPMTQAPKVFIDPPAAGLATGGTGEVAVAISSAASIGAFEAALKWDPAVFTVSGVQIGKFLGSTGRQVIPVTPVIDNLQGTLHYAAASVGTQPGASGAGVLFVLQIKATAEGTSPLAFDASVLTNPAGKAIDHTTAPGSVRVGGCMVGDFDCNCVIDIRDVMAVVARWGTHAGDADYDARFDLDGDADIDIVDVQIEAGLWGRHCDSVPPPNGGRLESRVIKDGPEAVGPERLRGASLAVTAAPGSAPVGATVTLAVDIRDAVDLAGFQLALAYDPARLRLVGVQLGDFLSSTGRAAVALGPQDTGGAVQFGAYTFPGAAAPSGSGRLATCTFQVLTPGASELGVIDAVTVDSGAHSAQAAGASAAIEGQPGAPPAALYLPFAWRKH